MNILALDLGTKTGWALSTGALRPVFCGTWELETARGMRYAKKLRMDRRLDPRVSALLEHLRLVHGQNPLEWIFFEDVRFASSQAQAHLWASFRGAVWAFAHLNGIFVDCIDTGKLKKFATGYGAAKKPEMASALSARFSESFYLEKELVKDRRTGTLLDDNGVDAVHLLSWAHSILKPT